MPHAKDFVDTDTVAAGAVAHVVRRLTDIQFPATKEDVLRQAERNGADEAVLDTIAYLPDERRYENPVELFDAIGDEIRKLEG
ncbi:MAG TPA: DUF2795 domain-containing protein [Candidatus Thermoplasmatota archaeon]|nr:DUF2795 domain-containing protein [Candidatus Thermoplasmatota archaeon]